MSAPGEIPAEEYRLFVRENSRRIYLRNRDEGVYLSPKGVGWFIDGESRTRDWSEINSIHPTVGHIPKQGTIGECKITFRDGRLLSVTGASKWGAPDDARNAEYARFLTDLHRAIPPRERGAIAFRTGLSHARHVGLFVLSGIVAVFFVLLPFGLTIYFRALEGLLAAGAGLGFFWPVYSMAKSAKPAEYDPARVPDDLYP